ncbi:MAG: nitrous oxide reductase accessory protein NosL [Candidatus Kapabacteria bacterium]|nr:nitrous oxide reductase accessory protein NosL [Candidatus Kapabacteria bacterium]
MKFYKMYIISLSNSVQLYILLTLIFNLSFLLCSCNPKPDPINFNSDKCVNCSMTISDKKWGAELVTSKAKVYKFDSIECMALYFLAFDKNNPDTKVFSVWTINYLIPGELIDAEKSIYVRSNSFHSPMGLNTASFLTEAEASEYLKSDTNKKLDWKGVLNTVQHDW